MRHTTIILLFSAAVALSACGSAPVPAPAPPTAAAKHVDPATAGSLSGRVTFAGPRPAPEKMRVTADPVCIQALGGNATSDSIVIADDGSVANAFVYIKDPLSDYAFDMPSKPVALDQNGCRYSPRVIGVRVGQAIDISNSDATLHNVHALPMINGEFNKGQPIQNSHMLQVFTAPEVMVRFKCDVHGWMTAYAGVMAHPFFAVTGPDGAFSMKGLPPGSYELSAWHEKFGASSQTVTIAPEQAQTANFALSAAK